MISVRLKLCYLCKTKKNKSCYPVREWRLRSGVCRCRSCINPPGTAAWTRINNARVKSCRVCGESKHQTSFDILQWKHHSLLGTCISCSTRHVPSRKLSKSPISICERVKSCRVCGEQKSQIFYSIRQWRRRGSLCICKLCTGLTEMLKTCCVCKMDKYEIGYTKSQWNRPNTLGICKSCMNSHNHFVDSKRANALSEPWRCKSPEEKMKIRESRATAMKKAWKLGAWGKKKITTKTCRICNEEKDEKFWSRTQWLRRNRSGTCHSCMYEFK